MHSFTVYRSLCTADALIDLIGCMADWVVQFSAQIFFGPTSTKSLNLKLCLGPLGPDARACVSRGVAVLH